MTMDVVRAGDAHAGLTEVECGDGFQIHFNRFININHHDMNFQAFGKNG